MPAVASAPARSSAPPIAWVPKSWAAHCYTDIRRFQLMPRGGHFAAWEQPELLAKELKGFFFKDVDAKALCGVGPGSRSEIPLILLGT